MPVTIYNDAFQIFDLISTSKEAVEFLEPWFASKRPGFVVLKIIKGTGESFRSLIVSVMQIYYFLFLIFSIFLLNFISSKLEAPV